MDYETVPRDLNPARERWEEIFVLTSVYRKKTLRSTSLTSEQKFPS